MVFEGGGPSTTRGPDGRVQIWDQVLASADHLPITPEGRFWMKNLWPVSLTICQALEAVLWNIWCVLASTKQRVFQVCVIHWSLSKNKVSEQISMFQIQSCAEQQIWLDDLSKKREFAQIPIEEHSHSRGGLNAASSSWRSAKAEKLFLAGIWIDCNQSS